ncbi:beta-ketoacyl synthase chain length factor [Kangiella shandongensis]|uniref:beta-ketoacyl synthase chain length factor n=1 Tax=Kangiella shandongensis TaxID=2763258 RepID=UPI001CBB4F70|nr:beta-ketoacyl synthase chain length factor [Kangiella shandongensis]
MTNNSNLSFSILSSHCWVDPKLDGSTVFSPDFSQQVDFDPIELKQIPAIKRRRLNSLSKMALHSSLMCLQKAQVEPANVITVFASQHGELNRTVRIVSDMVTSQEISPKDFSLSVHNAALGLYSIFNKNKQPGTSIAANTNTFGYGLIESINFLKRFPEQKVLLTCFDLEVNQPFAQLQKVLNPSRSVSLLLSLPMQDKPSISFNFKKIEGIDDPKLPLDLAFFDFLAANNQQQQMYTEDTAWEFEKHAI